MKRYVKKHKAFVIAFLLNVLFMILALLFCDQKYEVSDDFVIDALLSGAYGSAYNPNMIYSNFLLGRILVFFYKIIPFGSIYFVMLLSMSFLCLTICSYYVLKKNTNAFGVLLVSILILFFSDDLYISVTFTKVSTILLITGGIVVVDSFVDVDNTIKRIIRVIIGTLLFLLGSMLRFNCVPMTLGFLLIVLVRELLRNYKMLQKFHWKLLVYCVALVGIAFGLNKVDYNYRLSLSEEKDYREHLQTNVSMRDYYHFGYESVKDTFDELGLSENDYEVQLQWNFVDDDVFPLEVRKAIGDATTAYCFGETHDIGYCLKYLCARKYYMYPSFIALLLLSIMAAVKRKKDFGYVIGVWFLSAILLVYCVYTGRLPYRVEYSIFISAFFVIIYNIPTVKVRKKNILYLCSMLLFLLKLPLYMPDVAYKYMDDFDYFDHVTQSMLSCNKLDYRRYKVNLNNRRILGDFIDMVENDNDHYYMIAFNPMMQLLYYNYKPWERIPKSYLRDNYSYVGGVTFELGYCDEPFLNNGVDPKNPNKSLIDNERLIWVEYFPLYEEIFLREHYAPELQSVYMGTTSYLNLWQFNSKN